MIIRLGFAAEADGPLVSLYDALADPEAEARADVLFGGEERVEKAVADFAGNARTRVGDCEAHAGLAAGIPPGSRADEDFAAIRDSVETVAQ